MQRVRHANRGRLLLRTPGPVPLWDLHVFWCRDQSLLNLSCLRTFEFRTPLGTSLLLLREICVNCLKWWWCNQGRWFVGIKVLNHLNIVTTTILTPLLKIDLFCNTSIAKAPWFRIFHGIFICVDVRYRTEPIHCWDIFHVFRGVGINRYRKSSKFQRRKPSGETDIPDRGFADTLSVFVKH